MRRLIGLFALLLVTAVAVRTLSTADLDAARRDLQLEINVAVSVEDWTRQSDAGVVARLRLDNGNAVGLRDVTVECVAFDGAGSEVGRIRRTLAEPVGPKARLETEPVGLGALDPRTSRITCSVWSLNA